MKKALVLGGGGTRGAYQYGVIRALRDYHLDDWQIITGCSIGAINGTLIVQGDFEAMDHLWHELTQEDIIQGAMTTDFNLDTLISERNLVGSFFKNYLKEKGADITPFKNRINEMFHKDVFAASPIDFGCVALTWGSQKPVYVSKEMMVENGPDWLLATSAAFPALPIHRFSEGEFVDGGYYDNLPIDYALRLGADEIVAIDLHHEPVHPNYLNRSNITYIYPKRYLGRFLSFKREDLDLNEWLGYHDALKALGYLHGILYTFEKASLPAYFKEYYRDIELLETKIKQTNNLNESFRSEQLVIETLCNRTHMKVLGDEDFFYALMDCLLEMYECDLDVVYTYKQARNLILSKCKKIVEEDAFSLNDLGPSTIASYAKTLSQRGIVERIAHGILYPDHEFMSENMRLTIYPFEAALAMLLIYMLNELGEEDGHSTV